MKISEFASSYNVSNDTVRYYMELNLITPEKRGGHYYFDEKCQSQMQEIMSLKEMDFSLQEIKRILNFKRIGKLSTYQKNNYYQSIYKSKFQDVERKLTELTEAREKLAGKLADLESESAESVSRIGIDLTALNLFTCPVCDKDLLLSAEVVEANQVMEGSLNCQCGERLEIKEGILYVDYDDQMEKGPGEGLGERPLEEFKLSFEENHIENYINEIDPDYIDVLYQSLEWQRRQLDFAGIEGRVIMEPGSGSGFFLRQIYGDLSPDNIYICIDKQPQVNKYLKQLLEMTERRARIIFITADLPALPLKENVVDLLIDFTGTSSYSFENKGFLPGLLDRYLKKEITMLGTYIIYHKFGPNNIVPEKYRDNFKFSYIRDGLLKMGFQLEKEQKEKYKKVEEGFGKYETYAQPGDQVYGYQVLARRWG